jgi:hypothetical protein
MDDILKHSHDAASLGISERAALLWGATFYIKRVKEYVSDYGLKSKCGYELDRLGELKANLTVALGFAAVDHLVPTLASAAETDWDLITSGIDFKRMERNNAVPSLR